MDRTRVCGTRNPGSIPGEGTDSRDLSREVFLKNSVNVNFIISPPTDNKKLLMYGYFCTVVFYELVAVSSSGLSVAFS